MTKTDIVGTVTTTAGLRKLATAKCPADLIEVRVDALMSTGVTIGRIAEALDKRKHPVLLTLRIPAEGGQGTWTPGEREAAFLLLLEHADWIDLELATLPKMQVVADAARRAKKKIILSAHAIEKPASPARFARWERDFVANARRATVCKIAARVNTLADLHRLAGLLLRRPKVPWALMGLGPHGARSRAVLAGLGSRLAYGYLDQPAAPGQPSVTQLRKLLS